MSKVIICITVLPLGKFLFKFKTENECTNKGEANIFRKLQMEALIKTLYSELDTLF